MILENHGRKLLQIFRQMTMLKWLGKIHNPNLLFVYEQVAFASWNMGKSWEKINNNLPNVSVRDLDSSKDRDLVVATHGRGVFILDDIHPIEDLKN